MKGENYFKGHRGSWVEIHRVYVYTKVVLAVTDDVGDDDACVN